MNNRESILINNMLFMKSPEACLFIITLIVSLAFPSPLLYAESADIKIDQPNSNINDNAQKVIHYKNEAIELELKIKHAELEVKRLLAVESPEEEFDAKNEAIGIKYEIAGWQAQLKNIKATITELEKFDRTGLAPSQNLTSPGNGLTSNQINTSEKKNANIIPRPSAEMIEQIRRQQRAFIQQSYTMEPAAAALNLAKAKALEPLLSVPLLGDKSPLGSFFPASSTTRYNGMMIHMGGNQYMLETYLRPGKQEFVIGNLRFMRIVPVEYDGVISLVLLDLQDASKPTLEYFTK